MKVLVVLISVIFFAEISYYVTSWFSTPESETSAETLEQALYCDGCKEVDPILNDLGLCCNQKPLLIDVSVRTVYVCEACGQTVSTPDCCAGAKLTKSLKKTPLAAVPTEASRPLADRK
jgi:hypothetical protein